MIHQLPRYTYKSTTSRSDTDNTSMLLLKTCVTLCLALGTTTLATAAFWHAFPQPNAFNLDQPHDYNRTYDQQGDEKSLSEALLLLAPQPIVPAYVIPAPTPAYPVYYIPFLPALTVVPTLPPIHALDHPHPFIPREQALEKQGDAHNEPTEIIISVTSSNIMSQAQYEQDFPNSFSAEDRESGRYKEYMLPLNVRNKILQRHLYYSATDPKPGALSRRDFVCLQETGPDMRGPHYDLKKTIYNSTAASLDQPSIVDLLYDKAKYTLIHTITHQQRTPGRYLGGIFAFKNRTGDQTGFFIGAISIHVQYEKPHQVTDLLSDIEQAAQRYPQCIGWIVGGDFNADVNKPNNKSVNTILQQMNNASFRDSAAGWNEKRQKRLTALGKIQLSDQKGALHPWYTEPQGIDYFWFRNDIKNLTWQLLKTRTFPSPNNQPGELLTGGNLIYHDLSKNAAHNGYDGSRTHWYSDHASITLILSISLAPTEPTPQPPQARKPLSPLAKPFSPA